MLALCHRSFSSSFLRLVLINVSFGVKQSTDRKQNAEEEEMINITNTETKIKQK